MHSPLSVHYLLGVFWLPDVFIFSSFPSALMKMISSSLLSDDTDAASSCLYSGGTITRLTLHVSLELSNAQIRTYNQRNLIYLQTFEHNTFFFLKNYSPTTASLITFSWMLFMKKSLSDCKFLLIYLIHCINLSTGIFFPPRAGFNTMKTKLFRIKYNSIA